MSTRRVSVTECPGGPLLIRGSDEVVGADGSVAAAERSVVALCRCGRSDRLPWCDSSHRDRKRRKKDAKEPKGVKEPKQPREKVRDDDRAEA